MQSAIKVGKYFVDKANKNGSTDMTALKLQKMVYIAHGWMLGIHGEPLVSEDVEAWRYGPVIPELYREIKHFGRSHIQSLDEKYKAEFSDKEEKIMDKTYEVYSQYSGPQLVTLTHKKETPWYEVAKGGKRVGRGTEIPNEKIKGYYRSFA